jgi:NhaC family Na+:H+ antiporter
MSATLGVSTMLYAPFALFNLLCPVIAIIYGFWQIALPTIDTQPNEQDAVITN